MRIRNKSMQLPFSLSLSPQTPSDLPPRDKQDQDQDQEGPLTVPKETRSGLHPMAHHLKDRSDGLNFVDMINKRCCMISSPIAKQVEAIEGKEEKEEERWSAGDEGSMRNANVNCEGVQTTSNLSFSSPAAGRWQEGERAFPLKKRKGSIDWEVSEETTMEKENNNNNNKTNKKLEGVWIHGNVKKKKGNGVVATEGSRCSRVNGRGWRCSQQTLVGYSLCEHHLGKGRLRSMASVRNSTSTVVVAPTNSSSSSSNNNSNGENDNEGLSPLSSLSQEEEKLVMMLKKKKKKNGMVKARSISSLLGQAHHETIAPSSL